MILCVMMMRGLRNPTKLADTEVICVLLPQAFIGPGGLSSHEAMPLTADPYIQLRDPSFCYKRAVLMLSTLVAIRLNCEDHLRSDAVQIPILTEEKITVPDVVDTWDEGRTTRIVAIAEYERRPEDTNANLTAWKINERRSQRNSVLGFCQVLQVEINNYGYDFIYERRDLVKPTLALSSPPHILFVRHGHRNFCRLVLYVWTSGFRATLCHAVPRDLPIVALMSEKYPELEAARAFYFKRKGLADVEAFASTEREDELDRVTCLYLSDVYGASTDSMELFLSDESLGSENFANLLSRLRPIDVS